jgi:hypothetical protein
VEDLFDHFEAYLHMKNAAGVKEVLSIMNRIARRRSNHQNIIPPSVPGATLLKQMYFCVDLALMLLHRRQEAAAGNQFRYFVVDSSPQGGRNWLLSKCSSISAADIPVAAATVLHLVDGVHREATRAVTSTPCLDALAEQLNLLTGFIQQHTNVPSAIGLSHANTAHKAAAFLHSLLLEVMPNHFQNILINTISFTADLGVEIGVPGFRSALVDLLPSWRQQFFDSCCQTTSWHKLTPQMSNCKPQA